MSPTIPVVCLTAAIALFAAIEHLRRRSPAAALTQACVRPLLEQTMSGDVERLAPRWTFLNRSIIAVPRPMAAIVAAAALATVLFVFNPFQAPLVTLEGPAFGRFVSACLIVMQVLIGLSLLQFLYLWRTLEQVLDRLAWHRLADAYQRVSPKIFPADLFPTAPRLLELQLLVAHCGRHARSVVGTGGAGGADAGASGEARDIGRVFDQEIRTAAERHWSESDTWRRIVQAATQPAGADVPRAAALARVGPGSTCGALDTITVSIADPSPEDAQARDDLQAMAMALIVRDALSRLTHHLLFIIGGVFLVFCSHTLFPFQAREQLQALGWTYVALTFTAIVAVLVQMKRHEVLSRLSSASADARTTWDSALVLKLAIFALVPLLSLFAAQFPEAGGMVLHWLEPVEKALP